MIHPHYSLSIWYTLIQIIKGQFPPLTWEKKRGDVECSITVSQQNWLSWVSHYVHQLHVRHIHAPFIGIWTNTNAKQRVSLCSSLSIRFLTTALQSMPRPPRGLVLINHGASEDLLVTREKAVHWPRLAVNLMMSRKVEPYITGLEHWVSYYPQSWHRGMGGVHVYIKETQTNSLCRGMVIILEWEAW